MISALLAKTRREGPTGGVVNIGATARTVPIAPIFATAASTIRAGVSVADKDRFDPSASA